MCIGFRAPTRLKKNFMCKATCKATYSPPFVFVPPCKTMFSPPPMFSPPAFVFLSFSVLAPRDGLSHPQQRTHHFL